MLKVANGLMDLIGCRTRWRLTSAVSNTSVACERTPGDATPLQALHLTKLTALFFPDLNSNLFPFDGNSFTTLEHPDVSLLTAQQCFSSLPSLQSLALWRKVLIPWRDFSEGLYGLDEWEVVRDEDDGVKQVKEVKKAGLHDLEVVLRARGRMLDV